MTSGLFVLGSALAMIALGGWWLRTLWEDLWLFRLSLGRRTMPIAKLGQRRIEARGELLADEPVRAHQGEACVWVESRVTSYLRAGSSTKSELRAAPHALLRDDSGIVALDLREVQCFGDERTLHSLTMDTLRERYPELVHLANEEARKFGVSVIRLEVGSKVVVWAERLEGGDKPPAGYRSAPSETRTLRGHDGDPIIVATEAAARRLWRPLPGALGGAALALAMMAYGGWLGYAFWVGWL